MAEAIAHSPSQDAWRARLEAVAAAVFLVVLVARCFVGELPFRANPVAPEALQPPVPGQAEPTAFISRDEVARAVFATALLAGVGCWLLAGAVIAATRPFNPQHG